MATKAEIIAAAERIFKLKSDTTIFNQADVPDSVYRTLKPYKGSIWDINSGDTSYGCTSWEHHMWFLLLVAEFEYPEGQHANL